MHDLKDARLSPSAPGPCACTTLRKATRALSRIYEESLSHADLTATQFAILRTLEREGALPLSRLAEALVMDRTSLYRAIRPLLASAYIAVESEATGRAKVASLTPTGDAAIDRALPHWEAAQARFLEQYGKREWSSLATQLLEIVSTAATL